MCGHTYNPGIVLRSRQRAKMSRIQGHKNALLRYRKLVDSRVGKAAVFEVIDHVFDIKLAVENWQVCAMGYIFVKHQLMFIKPFRHGVSLLPSGSLPQLRLSGFSDQPMSTSSGLPQLYCP